MAQRLVTLKNKAGDVFLPETTASQVKRGASTVAADLTAVETTANGAIQSTEKGASNGVAPLGADGLVSAQYLPSQALVAADQNVADIEALLALTADEVHVGNNVFVGDATDDETVTTGWALYRRIATYGNVLSDYQKLTEGEGLDVAMVDQAARDAANAAQSEVDALETVVEALGTVYIINAGDSTDALSDSDLILEVASEA